MKGEDAMQGSWSVAVDEKRPSLAVDDTVLVGAPAWWRMVAMDVVEDGGDGWGGGRRLVWGWCSSADGVRMGKWRERYGEPCFWDAPV